MLKIAGFLRVVLVAATMLGLASSVQAQSEADGVPWKVDKIASTPTPRTVTIISDLIAAANYRVKNNGPAAVNVKKNGVTETVLQPGASIDIGVQPEDTIKISIASGGNKAGGHYKKL